MPFKQDEVTKRAMDDVRNNFPDNKTGATGDVLDKWGEYYVITRNLDESDDDLRLRILERIKMNGMKYTFWKSTQTNTIYEINHEIKIATIVFGGMVADKVGTVKKLTDLVRLGSDDDKNFKQYMTLDEAIGIKKIA